MKQITTTILLIVVSLFGKQLTLQAQWTSFVEDSNIFSSPRSADLTGDGTLDFVIGGGVEDFALETSISAFDGETGNLLWQVGARDQIFGSAIFMDITQDGTPDVFIGGRSAEYISINGATGEIIWEVFAEGDSIDPGETANLYNFYNARFIPDQNDDDVMDILVANGGDASVGPLDSIRPPGNIMVLDAANGSILAMAQVPDDKETYMSPVAYDFDGDNELDVIFGTGGETVEGYLWRTTISDIMNEDLSEATFLLSGASKGFIPPPSIADINQDGFQDIIVNSYGDKITALDIVNDSIIWQIVLPGTETVSSPAIGRFTNDYVPDVFTTIAVGLAPTFIEHIAIMINGATGQIEFQDTLEGWSIVSPVAVDYDGDLIDEAIFVSNSTFFAPPPFHHFIKIADFNNGNTLSDLVESDGGTNLGSTPWIGDIDDNGVLDMVYAHHTDSTTAVPFNGYTIKRVSLQVPTPFHYIAWGAYMGTNSTCIYNNSFANCGIFESDFSFGNPTCADSNNGFISASIDAGTSPYRYFWNNNLSSPNFSPVFTIFLPGLSEGDYQLTLMDANGCSDTYTANIVAPDSILVDANINFTSSPTTNDGSISIAVTQGSADFYTYEWDTTPPQNTESISDLAAGTYTVTITGNDGCQVIQAFDLLITGLQNAQQNQWALQIYPNPASNFIQLKTPAQQAGTLQIFSIDGRLLWSQLVSASTEHQLNINHLPAGNYYLNYSTQNQQTYTKAFQINR